MYSDLALNLMVEVEEGRIPDLHKALSSIVKISDFEMKNIHLESKKEWIVFMHITFSKGTGKSEFEVPHVPG